MVVEAEALVEDFIWWHVIQVLPVFEQKKHMFFQNKDSITHEYYHPKDVTLIKAWMF